MTLQENTTLNRSSWAGDAHGTLEVAPEAGLLTPAEELTLQQLVQARYWRGARGTQPGARTLGAQVAGTPPVGRKWEMTRGATLHNWQMDCIKAWFAAGKRGVVKVVTGAGKTMLGLAIAEKLHQEDPELRVAVVVPTVVLLSQWREVLSERSNLPADSIGLLGGGHSDRLEGPIRFLICVLNSAAKKLPAEVERAGVGSHLLLIVDECHRAGASEMRQVFHANRAYSLGLSATPERDDDDGGDGFDEQETAGDAPATSSFEESVLGRELGPVIYDLNYSDAIQKGVLPPFTIKHFGLSLRPKEAERYQLLSREITDLRSELETGSRRGLALIRWCRSRSASNDPRAARLLSLTSERKRFLFRIQQRRAAVLRILQDALAGDAEAKVILFHESIDEVMSIFDMLRQRGYRVVAEHSGFPDNVRAESLRLFRQGTAQLIVSARSLIEGFNVPSADLGIIVAASASVRQRVQTLGRLLRKGRRRDGSDKEATLCVLYASKTVDELIYEKADWEHFTGVNRNIYFKWPEVESTDPVLLPEPPRRPAPGEMELDAVSLRPGGEYPGETDEGLQYSVDTQGTVRDESGNLVESHPELQRILAERLKGGGRFRVTPVRRYVTRLEKTAEGWRGVYLGMLTSSVMRTVAEEVAPEDRTYSVNDPYPLSRAHGEVFSVLQRDPRLIARKAKGTVRFVMPLEKIEEPEKRRRLRELQQSLARVLSRGHRISKITVTPQGHVVYVWQNAAFFLGLAPEGPKGFMFEGDV